VLPKRYAAWRCREEAGDLPLLESEREFVDIVGEMWEGLSMRQVVLYPGEDGFWVAECPSLPGCVSQGKSREEAIVNVREAIQGYIRALEEDKLQVPEDRFEALLVAV
jgi:predicted RNase H-like HicB family nuclease